MYKVKINGKGQVTIPAAIRQKMYIEEDSVLEVKEHPEGILLKPLPQITVGNVVGKKMYGKIIKELDQLRTGRLFTHQ